MRPGLLNTSTRSQHHPVEYVETGHSFLNLCTMTETAPFTVLIVGGGLVGSLASLYFARRGWNVEVYEKRLGGPVCKNKPKDVVICPSREDNLALCVTVFVPDPRTDPTPSGRSINLALSVRGISALQEVGVDEAVMKTAIPMKGRMIHSLDGHLVSQPYGVFGEVGGI